jgi:serine/threonine protein kinase
MGKVPNAGAFSACPYEIVSPIGAGGMGEVYRARDAALGRDVAVKVLPAAFSEDGDRLRRFKQEAQAAKMGPSHFFRIGRLSKQRQLLSRWPASVVQVKQQLAIRPAAKVTCKIGDLDLLSRTTLEPVSNLASGVHRCWSFRTGDFDEILGHDLCVCPTRWIARHHFS